MKIKLQRLIIFLGSSLLTINTSANESLNTRIHNFYQSPRAMGMGNAYSSIADDYAALFYNPSMLSFRENSEFQVNILGASWAPKAKNLSDEVKTASETAGTDNDKALAVSNVLENYYGQPLGARLSPFEFIWVAKNWGLSLISADITIDTLIQRQLGPTLDLYAIKDTSLSYAYSWLLNSEMSFGFLGRFSHRSEMQGTYNSLDLAMDSNIIDFKKSSEGTNLDIDLAFTWKPTFYTIDNTNVEAAHELGKAKVSRMFAQEKATELVEVKIEEQKTEILPKDTPVTQETETIKEDEVKAKAQLEIKNTDEPVKADIEHDTKTDGIQIHTRKIREDEGFKPNQPLIFSAVLRNLLSQEYSVSKLVNKDAVTTPKKNDRVLDLSVSYALYTGASTDLKVAGEIKNMMHSSAAINKCLHLGVEYSWLPKDWFATQLRLGVNQMYFTAGLGLRLTIVDLQFVTYGEEYGTADNKVENRVNAFSIGLKF